MSTSNKLLCLAALTLPLLAQDLEAPNAVRFELAADSPLSLISTTLGDSRATTRGGAVVLDLHMSVTLRNTSFRRVRGVTLLITAQEFAPGGKGSVARPSIDVPPSQEFTVPVDIRLVRPVQASGGPLVKLQLDGVLFDDLSFFGPNKLNSQRAMTFWETEAQRDRAYYRRVLHAKGEKGLRDEVLAAMGRQSDRPQIDVAMNRAGRSTASGSAGSENVAQFAFLATPNSPVEALEGSATISGNEASAPHFDVVNRSRRPIRYVEMGWLVKDRDGREYPAGAVPGTTTSIAPGQKARITPDAGLRFSKAGKPVEVLGMTGFVKQVEFADGKVWVPSREDINASPLLRVIAPSPEEQRLADVYTRKGIAALMSDLNRY
jgi:hypothetical protein